MAREGISLRKFSFSEKKPLRTKVRIPTEKPKKKSKKKERPDIDFSKYYIGFFLSTYIQEGEEKLKNIISNVNLKEIGYTDGTFSLVVNPSPLSSSSYYGIGGLFNFCCSLASRIYFEKTCQEGKTSISEYVDLVFQTVKKLGKSQMKAISKKHDRSSETFIYFDENDLKETIRNLIQSYYNIVSSKIEGNQAKFHEESVRSVVLISKESLIANAYDPETEIDSIEAYTKWLRDWIYTSADKSFILNAIRDLKEEIIKYMEENNLSDGSPAEIKSSVYMYISSFTSKVLKGQANEEDSNIYKAFDRILKMILVNKGNFGYLIDYILDKNKSSGVEGLSLLEESISEELKVLLSEESFEINQTSTLFTEDVKAYNLLANIMEIIEEYAPQASLKNLNTNLSLKEIANLVPQKKTLSPVFQRVLDGLVSIGVDKIISKGVIFYDIEYSKYFGSMVSGFMGLMSDTEVNEKRAYLMSVPIKSENQEGVDHYDPLTVLDLIPVYPEKQSLKKKGKKLKATIEANNPPFSFTTSASIITSGELKNTHFPMSDETYHYLIEIVYSVIKDVYKNTYNSIEEIIYDTDVDRTKKAYELMVERGIFQNSILGAFYFYRAQADPIIKAIYGNYYTIFFDWFFAMLGIIKSTGTIPGGRKINVFDFAVDVGLAGYQGWKKTKDGSYKSWRGKGFGIVQKDILRELDSFTIYEKESDRVKAPKPKAKEEEFSVLTGSIKNASRNIPYLFVQALTVKYGFYYLIEKKKLLTDQLHKRILLEAMDGEGFTEFKKNLERDYEDSLDEWEAYLNSRLVKPLYAFTTVRPKKKYRKDTKKFSKQLLEFVSNIPEILEARYLDSSGQITEEFLELAFVSIQAFGFSGKAIKEAGKEMNIAPYDDFSINDIENDILSRLAEEVYKDKIQAITSKEGRKDIIEEIKPKKKPRKTSTQKQKEKEEAEKRKTAFFESFGVGEESDEGDLFDF